MTTLDYATIREEARLIDFGDIRVDPEELAEIFQRYIEYGSRRFNLAISDVEVYANLPFDYDGKETVKVQIFGDLTCATTLTGLLASGTKFLDAIVWLGLAANKRSKPEVHNAPRNWNKTSAYTYTKYNDHPKIARCMFFYFFYVLTRARAPTADETDSTQPIPNFLKSVLSYQESPSDVAQYLASFDLNLMNHQWVKSIKMQSLSEEALNRFGLGVAGYRMAAPFKLYNPEMTNIESLSNAIAVAQSLAKSSASWNIHPATRDPNILQKYGNLNKNLGNLMLEVFTTAQLEEMVRAKIIFAVPKKEANHTNYKTWSIDDLFIPTDLIFRS